MGIKFKKYIYLFLCLILVVFLFCFSPNKVLARPGVPHCTAPYSPVALLDIGAFGINCCKYTPHPCDSTIDPITSWNNSQPVCCHVIERCGNGILEPGELCDDNNIVSGDGCDSYCQIEVPPSVCGNGTKEAPSETCDDGNTVSGDGCSDSCQTEGGNSSPSQDMNPLQANTFGELFNDIIGVLFWVAIVLCPLLIIAGGFLIIFAGLDMNKIVLGKKIILYTSVILGIILIIKAMTSFFAPDVTFQ